VTKRSPPLTFWPQEKKLDRFIEERTGSKTEEHNKVLHGEIERLTRLVSDIGIDEDAPTLRVKVADHATAKITPQYRRLIILASCYGISQASGAAGKG
jgi:hypothetical protein